MLEPCGLDRGVKERQNGITVHPYSRCRCLIWDATCVNTFASSNLIRAALAARSVADAAEVRKIAKYAELGRRFIFQPVAVETSGAIGKSTIQFSIIWVAALPCDFRISVRVISCSRECLWLFSGERLQHLAVVPWLDADIFHDNIYITIQFMKIHSAPPTPLLNMRPWQPHIVCVGASWAACTW